MGYALEMAKRMPATMPLPDEFMELFLWIEENGFIVPSEAYPGDWLGLLGSAGDLEKSFVTAILFRVATPEQAHEEGFHWFGTDVPNIEKRLVPFARTGGDGSHVGFWLDDDGHLYVVHLGSEGQAFVIGQTPLDFLRLLAIGYEEISGDCLEYPNEPPDEEGRNKAFRTWFFQKYGATVPATSSEILGDVPDVFADHSDDLFWNWLRKISNMVGPEETGN